ncbi:MAG: hypothetical protein K8M05_13650 [Deltaproteobacteria bacterium]|nr:hypothetical protein [Kofleriaceae bacterium]
MKRNLVLVMSLLVPACLSGEEEPGPAAIRGAPTPTAWPLGGREVSFAQVTFVRDGAALRSAWGEIAIDPKAVERRTGLATGYVSARTADRWLVLNLPVDANPAAKYPPRVAARRPPPPTFIPPVRTSFDLGTDRPKTTLDVQVVVTATPLVAAHLATFASQPVTPFPVSPVEEDWETGILPPDAPPPSDFAPPPPLPPWVPTELDAEHWEWTQPFEHNVDAAKNQCSNAALANGLAYLDAYFALPVPHHLFKGVFEYNTLSLPGMLDLYAQRKNVTGLCAGSGNNACADDDSGGVMDAIYGYVGAQSALDDIAIHHQGGEGGNLDEQYPGACPALPDDGPVSDLAGDEVTFDWLCDRIANGDAVHLTRYTYDYESWPAYPGAPLVAVTAHAVRAYACGKDLGIPYVRVLHDKQQDRFEGDDDPVCTARNGGSSWEVWWLADIDDDGKLNINYSEFFQLENAIAIEVL